MTKPKYYIVEASALPEVFLKVAEANCQRVYPDDGYQPQCLL